ncbi:MAG: hypothetical protein JW810_08260, partial [Sedimentisphaerales bacterium]|nr:hypothetical protein [Sedimentisphaerales bacterium]
MIENQTTQQIAEILNRIKQLPAANLEPPQFFANFLQLSVAATGSRGGAIWLTQADQGPQCYCHLEIERCGISESDEQKRLIVEAVQRTIKEAKPLVVPPGGDSPAASTTDTAEEAAGKNRCPYPLFFYPLRAANQVAMVLQYIGSELVSPADYRTIVGLLSQAAEAAETFLAHRRAAVLEDDRKALARLLRFSEAVHGSLDAEKVIYQLANLGKEAVGCTRMVVWVDPLVKRGLRAISGVDKPDRRAVLLQALEKLSRHCLRLQKPIVASREQLVELPEEEDLTGLLKEYFNLSQLNQIFLQPLAREDRALGVIIAEGFDETGGANLAGLMATVAKHGTLALTNALEMASVPWVRPLGRFQKAKKDPKKKRRWIVAALILVGALVACAFVPWTIQIDSDCRLTPRQRRVINAPLEGVAIARVVRPQGQVQAGELLVVLDDTDLQAELAGLQAEQA